MQAQPRSRLLNVAAQLRRHVSWAKVQMGPADPILGVTEAFKKDTSPQKINLGVGAYRDNDGKPVVLGCVRKAEAILTKSGVDHEYGPISGLPDFVDCSLKLAYGETSSALSAGCVAGLQSLSGTGAVRLGMEFIRRFAPLHSGHVPCVYIPNPTWGNHKNIIRDAGLQWKEYRYFDKHTKGLDMNGLMADVESAPSQSVFLLHACAHNPTGVDPSVEEWAQLSDAIKRKGHIAFFDMAYQGFASGDPKRDAAALTKFVADGHRVLTAQSFAKNFGLYGERVGCLSVVTDDVNTRKAVESQLKMLARPMYSNPPIYGARLVATVLHDPTLNAEWHREVKAMADRIIAMRHALVEVLRTLGYTNEWNHIAQQIGMFAFTGLSEQQVKALQEHHHVYMTADGRISMAGINTKNVDYLGHAIHAVMR
eukprot:GILJ01003727.1.p1 GENE.GILJ01003727.1~~GILJ01003727.1.p1  ORF type:complete len:424 (-),score=53.98 GILJ01003727.1:95-1366(-)